MAWAVVLAFLAVGLAGRQGLAEQPGPQVFAHYYTWWGHASATFPLKPVRGWYRNQTPPYNTLIPPTVYTDQIHEARAAGLAGFTLEWMGPSSPETNIIRDGFLAANNALPAEQRLNYVLFFDTTIWAMAYRNLIEHWYEPIPFDAETAQAFAQALSYVCTTLPEVDPNFATSYLHVDGRPAVLIYNAHSFAGDWQMAIDLTRQACDSAGGVYLIGDFEVSPHPMFAVRQQNDYPAMVPAYDAITNYTLFSGWTFITLYDYITQGHLHQALDIGLALGSGSAGGAYYPGIIAQYFKTRGLEPGEEPPGGCADHLSDRVFVSDGSAGYAPIYPGDASSDPDQMACYSRCTLKRLLRTTFERAPEIIFVTSWNEPYEGTMIEPTQTANPACYTMGTDFLDLLSRFVDPETPAVPLRSDFDLDGDVDIDDFGRFQSCLNTGGEPITDPCCHAADLNSDGTVNDEDFLIIRNCLSGTGIPADPTCAP